MTAPVLVRSLRDRRRSLVWWSVGVAAYVALIVSVYPSIRDISGLSEMVEQYPEGLVALFGIESMDLSSGAGYLAAELFGFIVPLMVLILTIGTGAAAVAGAEERGSLDLLLAHPISRRRVLVQDAALVAIEAALVGAVVTVSLLIADPIVGLHLSIANLAGTIVGIVLLGVLLGWIALVLGAATGSRGAALGGASAVAALAYLGSTLPELVEGLRPARWLSPYWYATAGSPIVDGFDWWHALVLLAGAAVVLGVGVVLFDRRSLAR